MKEGWEKMKLGDACELVNRGVSPKYTKNKGIIVLNQRCIRNHGINYEFARLHDDKSKKLNKERLVRAGDVLVNSTGTGTLGRVAQVKEEIEATVDSHITIVRPFKDLFDADFFGYAMIAIEKDIEKGGEGCGGQTELSRTKLKNEYYISFPKSIQEQQRIVYILDSAFAYIENAKTNTEKNSQNAKELFESYLKDIFVHTSRNWEKKKLSDIAVTFGRGKSKHRPRNDKKLYGGKYPFIQTGDVRNSNKYIKTFSQTYNETGLLQSKIWPRGTICITIAANIAETGILEFDSCFPDSIIGLEIDPKKANLDFTFYALQFLKTDLQKQGKGSAQDNINLGTFETQLFPFPSIDEQLKIGKILNALLEETKKLETGYFKKTARLDELKKIILQKAFKGELTQSPEFQTA